MNDPVLPPDRPGWDLAWRVLGGLVGMFGGLLGAVLAALYTPLYVNTTRLPLAPLIAVAANVVLVWFTYQVTGHRGVALLPGLAWMGLMILASDRTAEGDILLAANNWVALGTLVAGALAYTIAAVRLLGRGSAWPDGSIANPGAER